MHFKKKTKGDWLSSREYDFMRCLWDNGGSLSLDELKKIHIKKFDSVDKVSSKIINIIFRKKQRFNSKFLLKRAIANLQNMKYISVEKNGENINDWSFTAKITSSEHNGIVIYRIIHDPNLSAYRIIK